MALGQFVTLYFVMKQTMAKVLAIDTCNSQLSFRN